MLREQVVKQPPEIRAGKIELPADPDLEKLVDWKAVERFKA
jgi:hypothetical protein